MLTPPLASGPIDNPDSGVRKINAAPLGDRLSQPGRRRISILDNYLVGRILSPAMNFARRLAPWSMGICRRCLRLGMVGLILAGCATRRGSIPAGPPAQFTLRAEQTWQLNLPSGERFDASGLLLTPGGDLLTINDRGPTLYRIAFPSQGSAADVIPLPRCFTPEQLTSFAREKHGHYDSEGIAQDPQGRLYICEEANRWILRCDPRTERVERLPIDWSPVTNFFSADSNASFEGIAIGNGKLYVANERTHPVIIVVDLRSFKILDHFQVYPQKFSLFGTHYSDLCWHEGKLFVLCRQHRVVLEVAPETHAVLAEYDYRDLEDALGYFKQFPVGIMEGLAVDRDFFWLCTDNNGFARAGAPKDTRPTLLKCRRPKAK